MKMSIKISIIAGESYKIPIKTLILYRKFFDTRLARMTNKINIISLNYVTITIYYGWNSLHIVVFYQHNYQRRQ